MDFSSFSKVENGCIKAEVIAPEANAYTQYAWYLYEKSLGLVETRWYGKENVCSFQPAESGNYRVKAFVRYKKREEDEYEKTSQYTNWIVFYATKEIQYENLEQEDFRPAKATVYRIMWNEVPFEFLINYKPDSQQAVVLGTGSVGNHEKPYFSRCSWADVFPGSSIYYFDPSVYLGNSPLCWGYGTNDRWYLEDIATLLYKMLSRLGIAMKDTLFYGSSGGGFMSMVLAAKLRGKATVINPQFIVENYDAHHVKSMQEVCLKPGEELLAERTHVLTVFQKEGWFPKLHVIQNVLATEDIYNQITPFLEEISKSGTDCTGCLEIDFYTAVGGGHDIMPGKAQCIRDIEKDLQSVLPERGDGDSFPENSFLKRMLTARDRAVQNISDSEETVLTASCNFTGCFLPKPKMYMPRENIEKYANDLMTGKLWVLANIEAMHYSLETLDFGVSHSPLPQTFQLYLQSLNPVQILVLAYEKTANRAYLEFAGSFIRKWEEYAAIPENAKNNPFVFNDHAVALRAENLMYFGWVCAKTDTWLGNGYERLCHLLIQCGSWLNDDRHYTKRHNHGIIQDQALLHLGYVMSNKEWIAHAKERLLIQEEWAFNEEMVHTENSAGYAIIVAEFFEKIGQFLRNNGDPLGDKLAKDMKKTREFEGWSRKPNGVIAHVGDTSTPANVLFSSKEAMRRSSPECHKIFPRAGYYFYRSNRSEQPKDDTWKLLKAGYVSIVHKHADDASFMLYSKGYEIFVDCGMYGYTKNPIRQYLTSALAHNTVIVDGNSYQVDNKSTHTVGMNSYDFLDAYDRVSVFNNAYPGVEFQRDFYSADDLTILMDRISSETEHIYSQLFHLAEHIEVLKASDCEVLLKLADSGYVVRVRQYGDPVKLSVIRGDRNKPGYGLISRGTNHLDTITTLKFDLTAKTGIFATAITIEDVDGRVRLFDRHEKANLLRYDANEKAFTLGDLRIPSDRYQSAPPKKIALSIFGSCVSRDILEYATDKRFDLKTYIARQSVLSAISNPLDGIAEHDISLKSAFQRRMVLSDIQKDALKTLQNDGSEYLLIDLIDERFPLTIIHNSICTVSSEFASGLPELCKQHPQYKKKLVDRRLYLGEHTVDRMINIFCEQLSQIYPVDHIVLHRAKLVDHYIANDGSQKSFPESRLQSNREINEILDHMYRRIEEHLPTIKIIDEMEGVYAAESHKWGLAPMHFQDTYYRRVLSKLQSIIM